MSGKRVTASKKPKSGRKPWMKRRHIVIMYILAFVLHIYSKLKYRIKIEKYKKDRRQYFVLSNHQTAFDQFFVGIAIPKPCYFIASEDLFSKGFLSSVIRFLAAPIPIKKGASDVSAVMNCMRVAKEGASVVLFPEGNRTYHGGGLYLKPAVASLAKALRLPIMLFHIDGGYGVHPRWSDVVRKGDMRAYVSRIIEPEEYSLMSDEELLEVIREGIAVDEGTDKGNYIHMRNAEFLERVVYVCPECGISEFESSGDTVKCKKCGLAVRHMPNKSLVCINREFRFGSVAEWYEYQNDFVRKLDIAKYTDIPIFGDTARLSEVVLYKNKKLISENAQLSAYADRITAEYGESGMTLLYDDIGSMAVLGRNKLNIYHKCGIYQIKGSKRFNALKYMNIYYRYMNEKKGDPCGEFLGL